MKKNLVDALNKQIQFEMESAYVYLGMSLKMNEAKLCGFGSWLFKQYQEEMEHAFKLVQYLEDQDEKIELCDIKMTEIKVTTPLETAKSVLAHEQMVTSKINDLYEMALAEKDFATREFLAWFIREQVEEEKNARDIIDLFDFAGDNKSALLFVDSKLSSRQ